MTFWDYALALGLYGGVIALFLDGLYGLACLALRRWGGEAWME